MTLEQTVETPIIFKDDIIEAPITFDESLIRKSVSFTVKGDPFGKQRPRFVRRGRYVSTYTPKETVDYENKVRQSYRKQTNLTEQLKAPIAANILAVYRIPKNTSKIKRKLMLEREIFPIVKPDSDNIGKVILDPLNGITYKDDAGVVKLNVEKIYGETPGVIVHLKEI